MKYTLYLAATLLLTAPHARGMQRFAVEAGGTAGVPSPRTLERQLTGAAGQFSFYMAGDSRFIGGPSLAFIVNDRVGAQVDFQFKRFDIREGFISGTGPGGQLLLTEIRTRATSWETAVLGRYAFTNANVRPFAIGGLSIPRLSSGDGEIRVLVSSTGEEISRTSSNLPITLDGKKTGWVMGGGLEARFGHVRLAPEFRYIRRGNDSPPNGSIVIPSNQFQFLVGLSYRFF